MGMWVGRGRKARVAYGFDDIALVPGTVTINPNEVDIAWELCGHRFELPIRSEEHTSELQSRLHLVCRLLLEKKLLHRGCEATHVGLLDHGLAAPELLRPLDRVVH